jgi:hypothetical protein
MQSTTPESLSASERASWEAFCIQREQEIIPVLSELGCPNLRDSVIWEEFLKYRWSLLADVPFESINPLLYAQRTALFGPDLGAVPRRAVPRPARAPKHSSQVPRKQGLYQYFLTKRYNQARKIGMGGLKGIKEMTPAIAREWRAMTPEQKLALELERAKEMGPNAS